MDPPRFFLNSTQSGARPAGCSHCPPSPSRPSTCLLLAVSTHCEHNMPGSWADPGDPDRVFKCHSLSQMLQGRTPPSPGALGGERVSKLDLSHGRDQEGTGAM